MDNQFLFPPAIVKSADGLEQLAAEIISAIEAGESAASEGVSRFRQAGKLLIAAKAQMPFGDWGNWVRANLNRSERQVRRWIALAKSDASDADSCWAIICGRGDSEQSESGEQASFDHRSRAERVGQRPPTSYRIPHAGPPQDDGDDNGKQDQPAGELDLAKQAERIGLKAEEATKRLSALREIEGKEIGSAIALCRAWKDWAVAKANQAEHVEPPIPKMCGHCGAEVLLVTTRNGKKMLLDKEQGGHHAQFALLGGLAVMVESVAGGDRGFLYTMHSKWSCTRGIG